jgi:predicted GH43/DUF377 family glycosyl hydrolase
MKIAMVLLTAFVLESGCLGAGYEVAVYYFPNYHLNRQNQARYGAGWSEWNLVRSAKPRFAGHQQPKVPLWGYEDEADPAAMEKKIDAAASNGVTAWIFDWYWHNTGPFLERGLEEGFLKARNRGRLKLALMWANHDWIEIFPATSRKERALIYPGAVSRGTFDKAADHVIANYFQQPNYWRVGGKPYFSFYELMTFVKGLGGLQQAKAAMDSFRVKAKAAGLPGIHINAVAWGVKPEGLAKDIAEMVSVLGIDSVTSYCWIHHTPMKSFPSVNYSSYAKLAQTEWPKIAGKFPLQYYPNVSMGWDSTPRTAQDDKWENIGYPYTPVLANNTPAEFEKSLRAVKNYLGGRRPEDRIFTINAWNEWTEGSYLEPDTTNGFGYLEAIRRVFPPGYEDGRPQAPRRMDAEDYGVVLRHGDGPRQCDTLGARDVWVYESGGIYYMHYDAAGPTGWLAALATSKDLVHWEKKGPALELGAPGEEDSKSASYGVTYFDGKTWHMFYLGTPNTSPAPDRVPSFPYLTMKARGASAAGPWVKQKDVIPFRPKPGTYYGVTASPGHIVRHGGEYLQFYSASVVEGTGKARSIKRTLGIARTKDLNGTWTIDPQPIVPLEEQIENSSLYFEPANKTWYLFTNHVGIRNGYEYTDAVWVYWTKDLNKWNAADKAVVLDSSNCKWSKNIIGLPSVLKVGNRLAIFYDGQATDEMSHMRRDAGLAWMNLPLGK